MKDLTLRLRIKKNNIKGDKISYKFEARANIAEALRPQPKKQHVKKKNEHLRPKNNVANKRI